MKDKSKFDMLYESIMDSFDPAMGDNLFEHLVLTDFTNYLETSFSDNEIEVDKEDSLEIYCNILCDNGTIYVLFDIDKGSVYLGCEELDVFEELDINGVQDLFKMNLHEKIVNLKNELKNLD